jgi:hypothetical protein
LVPPVVVVVMMALSACAIALSGLHHSPVTLGRVPVWLIAVGPPLVVALVVFATNLVRLRRCTTRWGACVLVAFVAGSWCGQRSGC